jgi:hypothetical protein
MIKVGQYLKIDNLRFHVSDENNWYSFLKNKLTNKGKYNRLVNLKFKLKILFLLKI